MLTATGPKFAPFAFASTRDITPPPYYNKPAGEKNGMHYVRFGTTGAVVSRICLGLMSYAQVNPGEALPRPWTIAQQEAEPYIQQALDAGITFYDTAEIYADGRSEVFFGNALQKLLPQSRFTREDLFISTKINPARSPKPEGGMGGIQRGLSRKAIFAAVEGSLQRLQTPYIDLYFIHRYDPNTSPEETMRALHDLVTAGRLRYIGASSMFLWQLVRLQNAAIQHGWTRFSAVQNLINLIYREDDREMNPYCRDNGIALMPYSPLAAGVLGRKTPEDAGSSRAQTDNIQRSLFYKASDEAVTAALRSVAEKRGLPPAQVALAWVLQRPGVASPIIGATKQHHIQDAVEALRIQLTEDEIRQLEEPYQPHAIAGHN